MRDTGPGGWGHCESKAIKRFGILASLVTNQTHSSNYESGGWKFESFRARQF